MKHTLPLLLLFFTFACSSEPEEEKKLVEVIDTTHTSQAVNAQPQVNEEGEYTEKQSFITYEGAVKDKYRIALETFPAFVKVSDLSAEAIQIKDSLKYLRDVQELTDPNDKKLFMPAENRAYQAILAYQKTLQENPHVHDVSTKLIELTRTPRTNDSSFQHLPKAGKSTLLSHGNFFFLGGAPFILKMEDQEKTVYTDANGNPQTRYKCNLSENTNYIFNSLLHFNQGPVKVTFGEALSGYDIDKHEVRDIGFLKHEFVTPVFFLTELGLVPAQIVSVDLKLIPQNLGCVSDQPDITLTCLKYLKENDILGVYIPYHSEPVTSCVVKRYDDEHVWTIDLNNDGIAEFACVSDTFSGIMDDKMAEAIWFVNIDGVWKIIDWAEQLDCT